MPRWFCIKLSLHHVRCSNTGSIWAKFRPQSGPENGSKTLYKTNRNFNQKNDAKRPRNGSQNGSKIALFLRRNGPGFQPSGSWASHLRFETVWEPFGVDFGSIWNQFCPISTLFGAVSEVFRDRFGANLNHFGSVFASYLFEASLPIQEQITQIKDKENKGQQQPNTPKEPPTDNIRRA